MTIIPKICPDCAKLAIYQFREHIVDKKLGWSASLHCEACGCTIESDDIGSLPQELRLLVIAESGLWGLELHSKDSISMKAIHQTMQFSIKELAQLKEKCPCIIYEGTEIEAKYYFSRLKEIAPNINIQIGKID